MKCRMSLWLPFSSIMLFYNSMFFLIMTMESRVSCLKSIVRSSQLEWLSRMGTSVTVGWLWIRVTLDMLMVLLFRECLRDYKRDDRYS